jgi:glyoxylase-like metal-dependent hydrolase (beta-lactamase superfamily II)
MDNNTYLIADASTGQAAVIDPSFDSQAVLDAAKTRGWQITAIWLTHAHFDHIAGVAAIAAAHTPALPVGLHPADLELWCAGGGAKMFGIEIEPAPEPQQLFTHLQQLVLGERRLEVRHTPGHSPGHVIFYAPLDGVVFCGDLIFQRSVGRTDLPGSSSSQLRQSIHQQVFTLPAGTRLLPGHGDETTVGEEQAENPFL